MASLQTGQVAVGTSATLIATITKPNADGILLSASATGIFIGGAAVTTGTGLALPATTPVTVPTSGFDPPLSIYAVTATTGTLSFAYPA